MKIMLVTRERRANDTPSQRREKPPKAIYFLSTQGTVAVKATLLRIILGLRRVPCHDREAGERFHGAVKRFDVCLHYPEGTASKSQVDPTLTRVDDILPRKLSNVSKNEKHNRRINETTCSND